MKFLRPKRGLALLAAIVLGLFLFRPGVYRLRNRIATSIGNAVGRRVALDNVRLRLLPRPGFDLEGLVIYDDPSFSAEPMVRAQDVYAAIRMRSLLRARLEIATLSAADPSINLVRNDQGVWNFSSLLERNAQIPAAPTSKSASERRPAFPYLEATDARINFKVGPIKKSYALVNGDVAFWQDSDNSWSARMRADPVRTDFNLTDTGQLLINARWQRAANVRLTPLQATLQWRNAQLGQITKLATGGDRGWRGNMDLTASLSGTPEALQVEASTAIDGFHRYDVVGPESLRLATTCSGLYNAINRTFAKLACQSPIGSGFMRLQGSMAINWQHPSYDLEMQASDVPLASVLRLMRQAKKQIPADLGASGLLNANFHGVRNSAFNGEGRNRDSTSENLAGWSGSGALTAGRISSEPAPGVAVKSNEIILGTVPLLLSADENARDAQIHSVASRTSRQLHVSTEPLATRLRIGPVQLKLGSAAPVDSGGWISASGYRFFLRGDMQLHDLFHLEDTLGLTLTRPAADGRAVLDVSIYGNWRGFSAAETSGTAQLHGVRAEMRGLNTPIEIESAAVTLLPDSFTMERIAARTGDTEWNGTVSAPRHCTVMPGPVNGAQSAVPSCVFQFDLSADQLSTTDITDWITPHSSTRPWYRILNSADNSNVPQGGSPFLKLQAQGHLRVGRFGLKKIFASQLTTNVDLSRGRLTLNNLRAQIIQGTHEGNWTIDAPVSSSPPHALHLRGAGTLLGISLSQLSSLMNDPWITGSADGNFDLDSEGDTFHDLLNHATGKLGFTMRNGSLANVIMPKAGTPLQVRRFAGELRLQKDSLWDLSGGRLESNVGQYTVSGHASLQDGLNFTLNRGEADRWLISGTLAHSRVVAAGTNIVKRIDPSSVSPTP